MDASDIKNTIKRHEADLESQISVIDGQRRQLASTHMRQVKQLQEATLRLCHIFSRQPSSGFAGKLVPQIQETHRQARELIEEDQARQVQLQDQVIPDARAKLEDRQVQYKKAKGGLSSAQTKFDDALDECHSQILESNEEVAQLHSSLEAGEDRSRRLGEIINQMQGQVDDIHGRLLSDPVFAYFHSRKGKGNAFVRWVDRILSDWCSYPEQAAAQAKAQAQLDMWNEYADELKSQMGRMRSRFNELMGKAAQEASVMAAQDALDSAKSAFQQASAAKEDAAAQVNQYQAELDRLEDGTSDKTLAAIGMLSRKIQSLPESSLRSLASGTTTKEDDALVDEIISLGRPGSSGSIQQAERALETMEREIAQLLKRQESVGKIMHGIRSRSLVGNRSRFRSNREVDEAINRVSQGNMDVAMALSIIAAQHYLKPLPPPPVYSSSSSSSSSSSGGFGSGGGFGGGGFSSGGGFGGGGGFSTGGGF